MAPVEAAFPLHRTIKDSIENALKHLHDELCAYATPAEIWDRATRFESEVNIAPYLPWGHLLPAEPASYGRFHHAYLQGRVEFSAPAHVTQGNLKDLEQQLRALLSILSMDLVAHDHALVACRRFDGALPQGMPETLDYQSRALDDRRRALIDAFINVVMWRRKTAIDFYAVEDKAVLVELLTAPILGTNHLFHSRHIIIFFLSHIHLVLTHLCMSVCITFSCLYNILIALIHPWFY